MSTSASAARQVCRQQTGYNSSRQFLTSKKEKGREGFKINMLGAPELKLQMEQMTRRNWRLWASASRLGTHTTMSTLKAPGDISAPKYISEKAENNRPHSKVFQHFISGWSP